MVNIEHTDESFCQATLTSMTGKVALLIAGDRAGVKGIVIGGCLNEVGGRSGMTLYVKSPELGIIDCSPKHLQIVSEHSLIDNQRRHDIEKLAELSGSFFLNHEDKHCFVSGVVWLQGVVKAVILKEFCENGFDVGEWDTEDITPEALFACIPA